MADERWKYVVFNKSITEEESLDFYTTWAKDVSKHTYKLDLQSLTIAIIFELIYYTNGHSRV